MKDFKLLMLTICFLFLSACGESGESEGDTASSNEKEYHYLYLDKINPPGDFPKDQLKFIKKLDSLNVEYHNHLEIYRQKEIEAEESGNNFAIKNAQKPFVKHLRYHYDWIDGGKTNTAFDKNNCCQEWLVQFHKLGEYQGDYWIHGVIGSEPDNDKVGKVIFAMEDVRYFKDMETFSKGDWLVVTG